MHTTVMLNARVSQQVFALGRTTSSYQTVGLPNVSLLRQSWISLNPRIRPSQRAKFHAASSLSQHSRPVIRPQVRKVPDGTRATSGLVDIETAAESAEVESLPFVLEADQIEKLRIASGCRSVDDFLASLVIPTSRLARPPISRFHVGAVGLGSSGRAFLGVNLELPGLPLHHSVHAEQFMVANAFQHQERKIELIAVNVAPCGHCRQFLQELRGARDLRVIIEDAHRETMSLSHLLPHRFGPHDLLHEDFPLLLEYQNHALRLLEVPGGAGEQSSNGSLAAHSPATQTRQGASARLVEMALAAANLSYAPYSQSPSGLALRTTRGNLYSGSYMESAAYNPSISPLQAAIVAMVSQGGELMDEIEEVVLVETLSAHVLHEDTIMIALRRVAPKCTFQVLHAAEAPREHAHI